MLLKVFLNSFLANVHLTSHLVNKPYGKQIEKARTNNSFHLLIAKLSALSRRNPVSRIFSHSFTCYF